MNKITISLEEMVIKIIECAKVNPVFKNTTIDNSEIKINIDFNSLHDITIIPNDKHNHKIVYSLDLYTTNEYTLKHWVYDSIKGWKFVGIMKSNSLQKYNTDFNIKISF